MHKLSTVRLMSGLILAAGLALGTGAAEARYVSTGDGFENGNAANWAASGSITRVTKGSSLPHAVPHKGQSYLVFANPIAGPGVSLTNLVVLDAPQGSPCTLEVWVRGVSKTGALSIAVKSAVATGAPLGQRVIQMPTPAGSKRENGYSIYRINFNHGAAPFFVSIDAFGPIEVAVDDFSISCRTK